MARYDVNRFGRFSSPDALSGSTADPQTWNRYAYVRNNPLAATDATGMMCTDDGTCDDDGGGADGGIADDNSDGGCNLFCQASNGLSDWMAGGIAPDPSQAGPPLTGQAEFDALENPCSGECRYNSIISTGFDPAVGDPCVYLNNAGTGIESIDTNSSPGECGSTGGTWVQPGLGITGVGPNGNVTTTGSPFLSNVCSALPFAGVFNGLAAGGVASIYLGGGTTTLGLGAEVLTAGAISPAAPIFVGVFGVVAAATIACRAAGY